MGYSQPASGSTVVANVIASPNDGLGDALEALIRAPSTEAIAIEEATDPLPPDPPPFPATAGAARTAKAKMAAVKAVLRRLMVFSYLATRKEIVGFVTYRHPSDG
jgi:hypothetical protein